MPSADWAAAPRFDQFEYGTVGLFLAGLMAREARRQVAGHEQDEWPDLLSDYVIAPAGITDALAWDRAYFSDAAFAYDYSGDENKGYALPSFPGLGGALACSPRQYAHFLSALLSGGLVGAATLREMTRSHGSTDGFGSGMSFLSGYAQGMWHGPDGYVNSIGLQGYFPWLDQTAADPAEHLFGVLAQDAEPAFHDALKLGEAIGIPLTLVALALSARSILKARRARRMQARAERRISGRGREIGGGRGSFEDPRSGTRAVHTLEHYGCSAGQLKQLVGGHGGAEQSEGARAETAIEAERLRPGPRARVRAPARSDRGDRITFRSAFIGLRTNQHLSANNICSFANIRLASAPTTRDAIYAERTGCSTQTSLDTHKTAHTKRH